MASLTVLPPSHAFEPASELALRKLMLSYNLLTFKPWETFLWHYSTVILIRVKLQIHAHTHQAYVTKFLKGVFGVHMGHIINLIYNHRQSQLTSACKHAHEKTLAFLSDISPVDIHHAQPSLSSWASQLVGNKVH
jgi:hypothetical protein